MTTIERSMPNPAASSAAENLPGTRPPSESIDFTSPASPCSDHTQSEPHSTRVAATPYADHDACDSQIISVGAELNGSHEVFASHERDAAVELFFYAAFLDDVEGLRKATANRIGAFERDGIDPTPYHPQLRALEQLEHQAVLSLQRAVRKHPLGPWIKQTVGVGEKQGARLIASIGDIAYNHLEDRPRRGPAELWAYCGFRPGQRRQKGVKSNWNAAAKSRAFLIAESCLKAKARSPYGPVYDNARAKHADAVHDGPCAQCGPKGKPALGDSPLSEAHKHARALREVAKAMLKDLFFEAQRVGA